jgi:hypothetical protein
MKTTIISTLMALLCLAISSCNKNDSTATIPNNDGDFVKYCEDLNTAKQTQIYVKEHWKKLINKEVVWTGKVYDAKSSRSSATIYIDKEERPAYKGYNITLQVADMEMAGELKKRQKIKFRGQISNYKDQRGGIIIFTLISGEILEVID